jgi:hypothetical protein
MGQRNPAPGRLPIGIPGKIFRESWDSHGMFTIYKQSIGAGFLTTPSLSIVFVVFGPAISPCLARR